jgi:hypothetical protein
MRNFIFQCPHEILMRIVIAHILAGTLNQQMTLNVFNTLQVILLRIFNKLYKTCMYFSLFVI